MNCYPKIESVKPLKEKCLSVAFCNGVTKVYDCTPLLKEEPFRSLSNDKLFKSVKADKNGYGISWNDEIDISESELWMYGSPAE